MLRRTSPLLLLLVGLMTTLHLIAAPPQAGQKVISEPKLAADDPEFQTQGEYVTDRKGIQVIALGGDNFRAVIYNGGLPGAGWDGGPKQEIEGNADDMADLTEDYKKIIRKSPTLGAKPPADGTVLFDGTQATFEKRWKRGAKLVPTETEGQFLLGEGATTVDKFGDYSLHLEFLLPFMPAARGQGRSNSGAYHQSRYETQILDSFGLEGKDNECGGLYKIKAPDVNACFPPLSWQTYDVDITSAKYDESGKKIKNARITARLNGIVIHNNVELPQPTAGHQLNDSPEPGPLFLQNHGNPVRFRNIWIVPRDADEYSRRPIIPGFERFHARADQDQIAGGKLLLGELNCTSCHQADAGWAEVIDNKQAPILTGIGGRVRHQYLLDHLLNPNTLKPGSTMPTMLAGLDSAKREEILKPIAHFLASTGRLPDQVIDASRINRGRKQFNSVGCTICHGKMEDQSDPAATSVPLGQLHKKYGVTSLINFLKNPHAVRPGGRMPSLHLEDKDATDIAHYLLQQADPIATAPNVEFQAYHGSWNNLPDFSKLKPVVAGQTTAFNLNIAQRSDQFGLVFTGWMTAPQTAKYSFTLGSDDGSRLLVDGKQLVIVDGIHPHTYGSATTTLSKGPHEIRVEYFEQAGGESLSLEIAGPDLPKQKLGPLLRLTKTETPPSEDPAAENQFVLNRDWIDIGRQNFAAVGCANCHQIKNGDAQLKTTVSAKPLSQLDPQKGCLAVEPADAVPDYDLSREQRRAIQAALEAGPQPLTSPQQLAATMTAFNCYACHVRDEVGGPEFARNALFRAQIPEMGDEGRIPPPLNGVGDKLREDWLKNVLRNGAQNRPYMLARMPKFNHPAVDALAPLLIAADQKTEAELPDLDLPVHREKAIGQQLVSATALSCIKCHTFGNYPATGIQAIALTTMHQRLREDWFHRYLADPQKYRPGTRMPNSFLNGVSAAGDILGGKPDPQIAAMWTYLADGNKAGIPAGLLPDPIELKPTDAPIIYRNFITGLSPRGIAVGYPEGVNIAWDAESFSLKLIWHGAFIDAAKHWRGRGPGTQQPLGVHQMKFENQAPWATAEELKTGWPTRPARQRGYEFNGYQLDDAGRPTFVYENSIARFREQYIPLPESETEADLQRIINVEPKAEGALHFLVAAGRKIEVADDQTILVDDAITISCQIDGQPVQYELITNNGTTYVYCPIDLQQSRRIEQTIRW